MKSIGFSNEVLEKFLTNLTNTDCVNHFFCFHTATVSLHLCLIQKIDTFTDMPTSVHQLWLSFKYSVSIFFSNSLVLLLFRALLFFCRISLYVY